MQCVVEPKKGLLSIIPLVRRKREEEAQRRHNEMTWMVPGGGNRNEILTEAINFSLSYPSVTGSFDSTQASQWSTAPKVREKFGQIEDYFKLKRQGNKIEIKLNTSRIKRDAVRVRTLAHNYRDQKQRIEDMRIFL